MKLITILIFLCFPFALSASELQLDNGKQITFTSFAEKYYVKSVTSRVVPLHSIKRIYSITYKESVFAETLRGETLKLDESWLYKKVNGTIFPIPEIRTEVNGGLIINTNVVNIQYIKIY